MRTAMIALSAVGVLMTAPAHGAIETIDKVAAIVNKSVITQTELDARIKEVKIITLQRGLQLPPLDVLTEQILEQLINESLQMTTALRYGVSPSDEEIHDALARIRLSRKLNDEDFLLSLITQGTTLEEFKRTIQRQLTIDNISQGLVRSRIRISEQDIDNFLKSADAKFWISPDYQLSHILIALPQSANSIAAQEAEGEANEIYQKLVNGANFEELALAKSDGPLALQGGNLGWRKTSDLPTLFAEMAPDLSKGEVAKPARSQAGFHIIKLNDKRGETKEIVNQTKARHILIELSEIVDAEQAQETLRGFRQEVLDGGDFSVLAKKHSEDIGSKLTGGDLGWASPGQFVPEFEKIMQEMAIDEISEPFKSPFGWHIMQVLERRNEDMTEQALRAKARSVITSRRFEDELQLWIQEMRDDAFIETKI
ncbi:MAG: molecular chaperone SurA [Alteromonadaceae bacterium]|nr:MAG: molecular chaperone SurA [Alteromonadaceae bacterium]